jgi:DNA polymerase-3 subunit delta'
LFGQKTCADEVMWNVIGHERIVEALARSLREGRLSHAYLFAGPERIGKMALAMDLAQALECTGAEQPCGECRSCRRIRESKYADVAVLALATGPSGEARKEIGIEDIKALQQAAGLQPFEGKARVFIIDGADHLSPEAANRLLKTLEEPPDNVYIILLAPDAAALLPTIVSRCRTYQLRPVPGPVIEAALVTRHKAEPNAARTLSRQCEGRPGWAVAALADPALAGERDAMLSEVAEVAFLDQAQRLALAARLSEGFGRDRTEALQWLALARQWWRDVLLAKAGRMDLAVNEGRRELLARTAAPLSREAVGAALQRIEQTEAGLERNANARLALDVLLLHLPLVAAPAPVVR